MTDSDATINRQSAGAIISKEQWFVFADRLIALAYAIFGEAKIDITESFLVSRKFYLWRYSAERSEISRALSL